MGIIILCLANYQVSAYVSLELNMVRLIAAGANSMLEGILWVKYRMGRSFGWIAHRSQICDGRLDCAYCGECAGNACILGKPTDKCYLDFLGTLRRQVCFDFFSEALAGEGGKGDSFKGQSLRLGRDLIFSFPIIFRILIVQFLLYKPISDTISRKQRILRCHASFLSVRRLYQGTTPTFLFVRGRGCNKTRMTLGSYNPLNEYNLNLFIVC